MSIVPKQAFLCCLYNSATNIDRAQIPREIPIHCTTSPDCLARAPTYTCTCCLVLKSGEDEDGVGHVIAPDPCFCNCIAVRCIATVIVGLSRSIRSRAEKWRLRLFLVTVESSQARCVCVWMGEFYCLVLGIYPHV